MTILDKLKELELMLSQCKGRETEVFTRIVGYYRPVGSWNSGKKSEFDMRKTFSLAPL